MASIIALMVGMAILSLDSLIPSSRMKAHTRAVASILELASTKATVIGIPLQLEINTEERKLIITRVEQTWDEEDPYDYLNENVELEDDDDEPVFTSKPWSDTIRLVDLEVFPLESEDDDTEVIRFSPDGFCDGAEIIWQSDDGYKQSIKLWPLSGSAEIQALETGAF